MTQKHGQGKTCCCIAVCLATSVCQDPSSWYYCVNKSRAVATLGVNKAFRLQRSCAPMARSDACKSKRGHVTRKVCRITNAKTRDNSQQNDMKKRPR
eukprot:409519-Amphidinium_carterae.1